MQNNFPNIEQTGEDLELIARSYAMRQMYWPDYTWTIQTKYLKIIETKRLKLAKQRVDTEILKKRLSDLFNKINASFYHLKKLDENEKAIIKLGKKMARKSLARIPKGVLGIIGTPYEPIEYEYEALLVTLKSALDITAIILAPICNLSSDNIVSLYNDAQQVKRPTPFLTKLLSFINQPKRIQIINEFRNKNDGTKSKRNYAVHQGSLPTGTINIQFTTSPKISVLKTRTIEVGEDITRFKNQPHLEYYCTELFYTTCDLIIDAIELIINEKLIRGQKTSVYDQRRKR